MMMYCHRRTQMYYYRLPAITPNVYYVNGNHELYLPHVAYQQLEQKIRQYGIHILHGQGQAISADSPVMIWGVSDPVSGRFAQDLRTVGQLAKAQKPNILISHRPEHITDYTRYPFDIVISGHAHGGQWRVPYLINGLFAPIKVSCQNTVAAINCPTHQATVSRHSSSSVVDWLVNRHAIFLGFLIALKWYF